MGFLKGGVFVDLTGNSVGKGSTPDAGVHFHLEHKFTVTVQSARESSLTL